jgi:hypothetical protein
MEDGQNDESDDRGNHQPEAMQLMHEPHQRKYSQCAESQLRVSKEPVPAALNRSKPAALLQALRVNGMWGFDFEGSSVSRTCPESNHTGASGNRTALSSARSLATLGVLHAFRRRQRKVKRRARAQLALRPNAPAVRLHDPLHNCKPQSRPARLA